MRLLDRFKLAPIPFRRQWVWLLALITLALSLLMAACEDFPPLSSISFTRPSASSPSPVQSSGLRLGALLPVSGSSAKRAEPLLEALSLLVNSVNSCGGVNNASVNLLVEDDQMDPTLATAATKELINLSKVDAIVGGLADSVSSAVLTLAVPKKIPVLSPGSTSPMFTTRAKNGDFQGYWGRTIPSDTYEAQILAQMAMDRGYKTVSTIVLNTPDGISFEKAFTAAFEKLGGTILNKKAPTRHDPKDSLYSVDREAVSAFNPEGTQPAAVVAMLDQQTGGAIFRSAYELGVHSGVQILLTDRSKNSSFAQNVGKTVNGLYILAGALGTAPSHRGPGAEKLSRMWANQQNNALDEYVPQTWDAAALLILAAQAAGVNEGAAIKDKLRQVAAPPGIEVTDVCEGIKLLKQGRDINYQGASGDVDLNVNGDVTSSYDVWIISAQGKIEVIDEVKLKS